MLQAGLLALSHKTKQSLIILKRYILLSQSLEEHFDGWYWSSTEDGAGKDTPKVFALISSLTKGRATSTSKRNSFKIRPIIAIR